MCGRTPENGVGKTALLDYLAGQAHGCRVVRVAGVQSEMELPFAGLHQLCTPMLDRLEQLPGRSTRHCGPCSELGPPPDRFLVGLVFAVREPGAELVGLPELAVEELRERDAHVGPPKVRAADGHGDPLRAG
jgi:hypothetical protein